MSSKRDRVMAAFDSIRKNILSGSDARAFHTLTALLKAETKKKETNNE